VTSPESARLLKAAIYYARQARQHRAEPAGPMMLDRMLESQLAAELEPAPASWGFAGGPESRQRAAEVAMVLAMVLRPDGQ
jgi:hypothetical protein